MSHDLEMFDRRIRCLELQNRRLKWLATVLAAFALASTTWAQTAARNTVAQAQKFELRDDAGRLRAELAILNGRPGLRIFDVDGDVQSLLAEDSFSIFKKGGDNQAVFRKNGLQFGDGRDKTFVSLDAYENEQTGKLKLNDYRTKVHATVLPTDIEKLHELKQ
jgi:hypothetical protein